MNDVELVSVADGADAVETDPPSLVLSACFERLATLHSRLYPRQVLGVRVGMYAAEVLKLDVSRTDKRLFTLIETGG